MCYVKKNYRNMIDYTSATCILLNYIKLRWVGEPTIKLNKRKGNIMFSPQLQQSADTLTGAFQLTRLFDPMTARPKPAYGDDGKPTGVAKLVGGREVFSLPLLFFDDNGIDTNVSVSVFNKPPTSLAPMTLVRLTGDVRMVPWVRNGRIAWSLTADGVEVVDTVPASLSGKVGKSND